jgi:predicted trehalose synthase
MCGITGLCTFNRCPLLRIDVTVGHENYLTLFLGVYSVETGRYEIVYEEEERARFMEVVVKHLLSLCA